jgi:endoglucanase
MAGFDFGCSSDGTCNVGGHYDIVRDDDGLAQMNHLTSLGMNAFRLPVGWQYLVNSVLGGPLNETNLAAYDALVQGCLNSGANLCLIDVHNYARWDTKIIAQGGPTNAQFADLWGKIAAHYKNESRIAFGVMNEPHDVPDIVAWAGSVQAAVTAIRNAGATTQMIFLPGNDWTSAAKFISNGSAGALKNVTNPDGSIKGLIMDVHKYLDFDNSGTNTECVTNNIADAFAPLADWLRQNGRQAFLSETGGGNVASCVLYMCQQLAYLK